MNTIMIGYDLNTPRDQNDYSDLHEAIKELSGTWWHHLDSTWLVKTSMDATEVRDRLKFYVDDSDELLVVELGANWASCGLSKKASDWLYSNMPKANAVYMR